MIAEDYYLKNGNLKVPKSYYVNGLRLNSWISRQRVRYHNGELSADRKNKLDGVGMDWKLKSVSTQLGQPFN